MSSTLAYLINWEIQTPYEGLDGILLEKEQKSVEKMLNLIDVELNNIVNLFIICSAFFVSNQQIQMTLVKF